MKLADALALIFESALVRDDLFPKVPGMTENELSFAILDDAEPILSVED